MLTLLEHIIQPRLRCVFGAAESLVFCLVF
jgi:hypothetical protein